MSTRTNGLPLGSLPYLATTRPPAASLSVPRRHGIHANLERREFERQALVLCQSVRSYVHQRTALRSRSMGTGWTGVSIGAPRGGGVATRPTARRHFEPIATFRISSTHGAYEDSRTSRRIPATRASSTCLRTAATPLHASAASPDP